MVKRTDHEFVAAQFVALDALVLVRMIKSLHGRMALVALQALRTGMPASALHKSVTVLSCILEDFGWPPEVAHMMCIDAALTVMRILFGWTPTRLVVEHVEDVLVFLAE